MWKKIIATACSQVLPFNDYLLKEYREKSMNRGIEYIEIAFQEAIRSFKGAIEYIGHRVLSPQERIDFMVSNQLTKGAFDIKNSELQLVAYDFKYDGVIYTSYLFLPYLVGGSIVISDNKYYIQLAIIERTIYRSHDSVVINIMKSYLHFYRSKQFEYRTHDGKLLYDTIVTTKVHYRSAGSNNKSNRKKMQTPLLIYSLCRHGLVGTLERYGIDPNHFSFVTTVPETYKLEQYVYIKATEKLYIKIHNDYMGQLIPRRVIATLVYLLSFYNDGTLNISLVDLYDPQCVLYQIMLGHTAFGTSYKISLANSQAISHMESLETYLDPISRIELAKQGIVCHDFYDLVDQVFLNIDKWVTEHTPNDLYEKKIGVEEIILADLVSDINNRIYETIKKKSLTHRIVNTMFKMRMKTIFAIYQNSIQRGGGAIYNDNALLSLSAKKTRYSNSNNKKTGKGGKKATGKKTTNLITHKEHRFHPSFAVVESLMSLPSTNPGIGGTINPFVPITPEGYFYKPDYASVLDNLEKDLPIR